MRSKLFSRQYQHMFGLLPAHSFISLSGVLHRLHIVFTKKLNEEAAKRYIASSLKREYASENGTALNEALPKLSPLNPKYRTLKQIVFQKIAAFVEKFKGVGGQL